MRAIRLRLNGELACGLGLLALFAVVAICAPLLAPYDPHAFTSQPLERPGPAHPLGANDVGQDILSELIYGARVSLAIAASAATGTVALGTLVGGDPVCLDDPARVVRVVFFKDLRAIDVAYPTIDAFLPINRHFHLLCLLCIALITPPNCRPLEPQNSTWSGCSPESRCWN